MAWPRETRAKRQEHFDDERVAEAYRERFAADRDLPVDEERAMLRLGWTGGVGARVWLQAVDGPNRTWYPGVVCSLARWTSPDVVDFRAVFRSRGRLLTAEFTDRSTSYLPRLP